MSENNRPDSEQKNEQTSAEDILAQVDDLIADLENTTATQLYAAAQEQAEAEKSAEPSATESPTEQPPDQPPAEEAPPGEPEDISVPVIDGPERKLPDDVLLELNEAIDAEISEAPPGEDDARPDASPQAGEERPESEPPGEPAEEAPPESASDVPPEEEQPPEQQKTDEPPAADSGQPSDGKSAEQADKPPEEKPLIEEIELDESEQKTEPAEMSFIQRAQYHAKMRRREQTRLRRENARRIQEGEEITYQPMTVFDMRDTLVRLGISAVLLAVGIFMNNTTAALALQLVAYLITALPIAVRVAGNITHGRLFDEHLLVLLATIGAFALGSRLEAGIVLILFEIGKIASDKVLGSVYESLPKQSELIPEKATRVNMKGEERRVSPTELRLGELVLVHTGERIPIDGVVLRGEGTVDDSAITGESRPMEVEKDARVMAGSLYEGSLLLIRVIARYEDCVLSQIRRVQEESREHKAALEETVTRIAARAVPVLIVLAVVVAAVPPLFLTETDVSVWIYRGLTLLVACCPTALTLSVPLTFLCGLGRLEQKGIHVKGGEAIEKAADLRMVVFNKTGTLTTGELQVKKIYTVQNMTEKGCLALAATAEQLSQHPIARAIVAAYGDTLPKVEEFEEFPGRGVRARIEGRSLLIGNRKLMISRGVKGVPDISETVVYVACEGEYIGALVLEDTLRSGATDAVRELKNQGVLRTVLLTGDAEAPTQQAAEAAGIDAVHCGLLPEEKASKLDFLMRTIPTEGATAYVGDGICDIEELRLADVGAAMGSCGSRRSADAANVLVMGHDLTRLAELLRTSKRTHSTVLQELALVAVVKIILAVLAVLGVAYMWIAAVIDVIVTVLVVLGAARMTNTK